VASDGELDAEAARELTGFGGQLAEDLGGVPRLAELLEVLGWGAESLGADLAQEPPLPVVFKPRLRRGAAPPGTGTETSRTADLNDHTVVDAGDLLSRLAGRLAAADGGPPTLDDLAGLLSRGLRGVGRDLLADVDPADVTGLSVAKARARKRAAVGDIVAIPAADGRYFLAVALTRNVFGTALGRFAGTHAPRPVSAAHHPQPLQYPLYVDDEAVASGRWLVVGNDPALLGLFPAEPEIYHAPGGPLNDPGVGPHGAAETADGTVRQLTGQEAEEIGLSRPDFQQIYHGVQVERRLNAELG
jgi:hypothetical protein